ncbi:MAG: tetratricopeptide repeat-containing sensor histidine kinase [Bacteroidota bacterium]
MKLFVYIFLLLSGCLILTSCEQTTDIEPELVDISLLANEAYANKEYAIALDFTNQYLSLAEGFSEQELSSAYYLKGKIKRRQKRPIEALNYYLKSLKIRENLGNDELVIQSLNSISLLFLYNGSADHAIEYQKRAVLIQSDLDLALIKAKSLRNLALAYEENGELTKAKTNYQLSLQIYLEQNDKMRVATLYNDLGTVAVSNKEFESALEYFNKSLDIHQAIGDVEGTAHAQNNIGYVMILLEKYNESLPLLSEAIQLFDEIDLTDALINSYQNQATVWRQLHELESAITTLKRAELLAKSGAELQVLQTIYSDLSDTYQLQNKSDLSRFYKVESENIIKKIEAEDRERILLEITKKYEIEQAEKEFLLAELQVANDSQKIQLFDRLIMLLGILLGLIITLYFAGRFYSQKRYMSNLLNLIAHDVRNPLNHITGASYLLRHAPETADEQAKLIEGTVTHIKSMISNLLEQKEDPRLAHVVIDPSDAIFSTLRGHRIVASNKGIEIIDDIIVGEFIKINLPIYTQAVDNLISNAIKFSEPKTNVEVALFIGESELILKVSDQGPGICSEDLTKLFRKKGRLSNRPTAGESSLGLGLYITKKNIEAMNGKIWCTSEAGQGSHFYIAFPLAD